MRYIDLMAQTILILLGITFAIVTFYNGNTAGLLLIITGWSVAAHKLFLFASFLHPSR
jgi:hypothetical protein